MAKRDQVSAVLTRYERFGIDLSLDRIKQALVLLGNPQESVPFVHVTGTNGKGSVCAYLSSVLTAAGYRVGRYTSPHLVDWNERISINARPVETDELIGALHQVERVSKEIRLTQFEVITAAAWFIFAQRSLDIAVVEVGLGGRLDATNVCDRPLVSIITSISLEHSQRLGSTFAEIAREKAGIIKPRRPVVVGQLPAEAMAVVKARASALKSPLVQPEIARRNRSHSDKDWAIAQGISYPLGLNGSIQLLNSALVISAIMQLREQGWNISDEAIQVGMGKTQWPGRLQWVTYGDHRLLIDGAHNPAAAQVLRDYVDRLPQQNIHWIVGMLSTKDHRSVFEMLLKPGDRLSLVPVAGHSSATVQDLEAIAEEVCPALGQTRVFESLEKGLSAISLETSASNCLHILCGSLYLIGDFLAKEESIST